VKQFAVKLKSRITVAASSMRLYMHAIATVELQSSNVPITTGPRFISGKLDARI